MNNLIKCSMSMKTKEWLERNVDFKREDAEVRDNKGYCYTLAIVGLIMGAVTGVLAVILQFVISSKASQELWTNIIASVCVVIMLAYAGYLLLPMFKNSQIDMGSKVVTTLLALASLAIPFVVGIYVVVLAFMIVAAIAALWFAGKIWSSTAKSSLRNMSKPQSHQGPDKYELEDGTIVTDTGFGGYRGNDGNNYERHVDGTFSKTGY